MRNAADFRGASIVERIQAAILDCGADPCQVYVPAGTYQASSISTWNSRDSGGTRIGILLPSNVEIYGASPGHTIIRVDRTAADPTATLLANANELNRNIHIHDMTIVWTDAARSFDWVSIFICHGCDQVELDHLSLEGNPNKLVNLLDSTGSNIHDNNFILHSTGYGHGDNALGISRFDPKKSVGAEAGVVRDNHFGQIGDFRVFSMLIVAQSGVFVHSNVFEAALWREGGNATAIETGQDNLGRLPERVKISENVFRRTSIAHGGLNSSEITSNFFDHGDIYIAMQEGSTSSTTGVTIADNEVHFGSISIAGLEHIFTGRYLVTNNRVFDGGIGVGNSLIVGDVEVISNTVKYSRNNNGIDCNSCSVIRGNLVQDIGQNGPNDLHAGYLIGGTVVDVSGNIYIDDQHDYSAGTICSVASLTSQSCMTSGRSRWVRVRGGEWGFGWGNRTLFLERGSEPIRAFPTSHVLELDDEMDVLPAGTIYHLSRTTFNGFEINAATIDRFADNVAISGSGSFNHAAIQEDGTVTIRNLSGNVFHPYKCYGRCALNYMGTVAAQ